MILKVVVIFDVMEQKESNIVCGISYVIFKEVNVFFLILVCENKEKQFILVWQGNLYSFIVLFLGYDNFFYYNIMDLMGFFYFDFIEYYIVLIC